VKKNIFFLQYKVLARIARKVRKEDFPRADLYVARNYVCRLLAAECFEVADRFKREREEKLSLPYMELAATVLGLSLGPKKLKSHPRYQCALYKRPDARFDRTFESGGQSFIVLKWFRVFLRWVLGGGLGVPCTVNPL
jgi:hypothetical protein